MRSNAEKLKIKFAKSWEDDGTAQQEIRKFLHKYTSALLWKDLSGLGTRDY